MTGKRPAAGLLGLSLLLACCGLRAETLSVSFQGGVFLPKQQSVKDCYGDGVPAGAMVRVYVAKNFGIGAGLDYLRTSGQAVGLQENGLEYPLKLRIVSVPVFVFYRLSFARLSVCLAGGAGYHSYREKWTTIPLEYSGKKWSPRIVLAAEYKLVRGLSLLGSVTYDDIKTGRSSLLAKNVNLGGIRLAAGVSLAVF